MLALFVPSRLRGISPKASKDAKEREELKGVPQMGEFLVELWGFLKQRKKFWLLPVILCLVLLGGLVVLASGSAIAPFIYTLF